MKEIVKVASKGLKVGYPDTDEERDAMFRLRTEVYRRDGYITAENDKDEYDLDNKCVYFIAKIDEKLVGAGRVIIDDPLPTEVYFDFKEPGEIARIPRNKRCEISRLVGVAKGMNHLISLSVVKAMIEWAKENDCRGGYSFVQSYLVQILSSIRFPIHIIEPCALKNIEGPLYDYVYKSEGEELQLIYYLRDESAEFMEKMGV